MGLLTPLFQASGRQDCERIISVAVSPMVCGNVSRQPQDTNPPAFSKRLRMITTFAPTHAAPLLSWPGQPGSRPQQPFLLLIGPL